MKEYERWLKANPQEKDAHSAYQVPERPLRMRFRTYDEYYRAKEKYERWLEANPQKNTNRPEKDGVKSGSTSSPIIKSCDWSEAEKDEYRAGQQRLARYRHQSAQWRKQSSERSDELK